MQYWDTSTLAKLYVSEPDSGQFAAYLAATGPITTSELARWELFRVLARKEAEGQIPTGAAEAIFGNFLADIAAGKVLLVLADRMPKTYAELIRIQDQYAAQQEAELADWRRRRS